MPDLFDKFKAIETTREKLSDHTAFDPLNVRVEEIYTPTEAKVMGRRCVMLGTNNYLGLTMNPDAMTAASDAATTFGTGTTGSRVANGSYAGHQDLEKELAAFYGYDSAILFTTGYQANVGFISAMSGPNDTILIDSDSHASIYDGCKMGNGTTLRFRHNSPEDLERKLKRLPEGSNKLVIIESIYSMLGDIAPLKEIVRVAKKYDAYIMVDEAHSMGFMGETGRGLCEAEGVLDDVDFILGTFSKSVGTIGGFCVSKHASLETIRYAARSYLFTASLPPAVVEAARANLKAIQDRPVLRETLWRNAHHLYNGLQEMGFQIGPDSTPVMGVVFDSVEDTIAAWNILLEHGVYVNMALPPATPHGISLLRCSVCAAHTTQQIDFILEGFRKISETLLSDKDAKEAANQL